MIESASFERLTGATLGNYRLEQLVSQEASGPVFLARTDVSTTTYLLRILPGPTNMGSRDRQAYLERFQYQANQIATLQHPNILSLLDHGIYRGMPYLVTPYLSMRSLHSRLAKNGPLDIFTVGRYLDQITATLEYAHQHGVLHGSLSVDCIYIRLDGQLAVADFGLRSLLLMDNEEVLRGQLTEWSGACTPEQLLGKPIGTYSDVYALGAVLYALLTGSPVFPGNTPEEIAQQHLYASVPPLSRWRADLPSGLYSIIARALAKEPGQRFRQPGALANAYHRNAAPNNRQRVPFVVSDASAVLTQEPFPHNVSLSGIEYTEHAWNGNRSATIDHLAGATQPGVQPSAPHSLHGFSNDAWRIADTPRPALLRRFGRRQRQRTLLIASLIALVVVVGSVIGIPLLLQQSSADVRAGGQVTFFSGQNAPGAETNALHITLQNLAAPPAGDTYYAWLINDATETVVSLGSLTEQKQSWSLAYNGGNINLLAVGDKLEVTQEQGTIKVPTGTAVLVGIFPIKSFAHVQHLVVSYPETPGKIGLLMGMLEQTRQLDIQAAVLQNDAANHNSAAIECVTQNMLNIVEGAHGAHYQPLASTCTQQNVTATADGFGLLGKGYVAGSEQHASLALSQPDATTAMHQHAALMDVALTNVTNWVTTIEQDVLRLHAHPADITPVQEITTLADYAYHGVDTNGDGQIAPVPGEAGTLTAYLQGQLMATVVLSSKT